MDKVYAVMTDGNGVVTHEVFEKVLDERAYIEQGFTIVDTRRPVVAEKTGKNAILKLVSGNLVVEYVDRPLSAEEQLVLLQKRMETMQAAMDDMILFGGGF